MANWGYKTPTTGGITLVTSGFWANLVTIVGPWFFSPLLITRSRVYRLCGAKIKLDSFHPNIPDLCDEPVSWDSYQYRTMRRLGGIYGPPRSPVAKTCNVILVVTGILVGGVDPKKTEHKKNVFLFPDLCPRIFLWEKLTTDFFRESLPLPLKN